jgi:hypothetical protein
MKYYLPFVLGALSTIGSARAFVPAPIIPSASSLLRDEHKGNSYSNGNINGNINGNNNNNNNNEAPLSSTALCSDKKKKGGLDGNMRNKLVTESIAPWRTLRLFLYGSLGSGAFIGGLINGSGAIAGSGKPEFNLQTEVRRKAQIRKPEGFMNE